MDARSPSMWLGMIAVVVVVGAACQTPTTLDAPAHRSAKASTGLSGRDSGQLGGVDLALPTAFLGSWDTRAMWVWNEPPGVRALLSDTGDGHAGNSARQALFEFVAAPHGHADHRIDRLFFAARVYADVDVFSTIRPVVYDPLNDLDRRGQLRSFLAQASARGVDVEYLDGQAIWLATDAQADIPKQICRDVVGFNLSADRPGQRFAGIHLDIEPHTVQRGPWARRWWQNRLEGGYNRRWTARWRAILTSCRQTLDAYEANTGDHLTLSVDVGSDFARYNRPMRRFLDRDDSPVDYISVLNYYDDRPNQDGRPTFFAGASDGHRVVGGVDQNLALWRHVPVLFGLETGPPSIVADRHSFHQEGYRALNRVIDKVVQRCRSAGCLGVAIHHYGPHAYRGMDP